MLVCEGRIMHPNPPPAKQSENFPSKYSMSPTLGFNYSSKNKQEYIYTKRKKNTYIQRETRIHIYKEKGKHKHLENHTHIYLFN